MAEQAALLHRRPDLVAFAVTGSERLSWLNGLVTQEVAKLAPGAGAYGLAVGKTGKMLAEMWFVASVAHPVGRPGAPADPGGDHVLVIVARDRLQAVRDHFERHLVMEDAEMGPPLDREVIFAHGARVGELVEETRALGGDGARIDWTGRGDAAVLVAAEGRLDATVAALLARGAPAVLAGVPEWEALRIAWGLPRWGVDYDEQTLPQEASLEKLAVSFTKGCYLGQETVFMLEKRGHAKKKLVRLSVDGEVAAGAPLSLPEGTEVGTVTSATPGTDGAWLAIASVKYKLAAAGTELLAAGRTARVLALAGEPVSPPA
jgi:folate-binding protein YgfZ